MPITVTCPACDSRFSLSDDLYRRRVAGSLVKVKCRYCKAEIAVDATDPVTMPSHEAPRKHPLPPRPKAITQLGLGTPPAPASLATASPLPLDAASSPLPLNATVTPLPLNAFASPLPTESSGTAHSATDPDSLWNDDEETLAINLSTPKPLPRAPAKVAHTAPVEEVELIEAEEIPISSSGAPTLDALTLEAGGAHVPHGKPAPDEFLVHIGAGNENALGAPTIDVTSFAAEIDPPSVDVTLDGEKELEYRPARSNTAPLYDMGAVLSSPSNPANGAQPSFTAPDYGSAAAEPPVSEGRSRERKFVVAPQAPATATETARSRSSALLWVGLLAAAAAVAGVVGVRGHRFAQPLSSETQAAALSPAPVVNTEAALPAEPPAPAAEAPETVNGAPAATPAAPLAPTTPTDQNVAVATTRAASTSTLAAVKSSANAPRDEAEKPSTSAEPAVENPASTGKTQEVHNAPPPAAPDTEFDRAAARNALASAAAQASSCRKEGDPSGTANLTIIFAPSGRVTSAQIQGPPFSGTATGGCIASTMRRASVPAFSGDHVTVSKTIVVQ